MRASATRRGWRARAGGATIALAVLAICGFVGCALKGSAGTGDPGVPVARVERTDFRVEAHATGELRALHSVLLTAPAIGGGTLEIIQLVETGAPVQAGQVVVAFDPSAQEYNLATSRFDLEQAKQEILQARDNSAVQAAEDQTNLLKDGFAVRQAQLKVDENELVSAIDAKKNVLALNEAKRALAQLEQDIRSHAASSQATISVSEQTLAKARLAIAQAEQNIVKMRVRSPIAGLVVVRDNEEAMGGIFFSGMTLPQYQIGDQVGAGSAVAEVVDTGHMQLAARLQGADRTNVKAGDPVEIHVNAIPGVTFAGRVGNMGGMATGGFFEPSGTKVDMNILFDHPDARLRPGFSARVVILGRQLHQVLTIPREAIFDLTGTPTVYVKNGGGFRATHVKIRYLTDARAVVSGVNAGAEVALVNPEAENTGTTAKKPAAGAALGPPGR